MHYVKRICTVCCEAGREIGHEAGLAEGKNQAVLETAKRMLALQEFTPEKIAAISGLPSDEVRKLQEQDNHEQ